MSIDFDIHSFGERGLLLQFYNAPSEHVLNTFLRIEALLFKKFKLKARHTYTEILIPEIPQDILNEVHLSLLELPKISLLDLKQESYEYSIPVCYDNNYGWDIDELAQYHNLAVDEVVEMHTAQRYLVYFIGFLPGFPYLLGMDTKLATPRKKEPRQRIPQGSVAIGGEQTGVYPQESPAGWNVIGRTPILFFNPKLTFPSFLKPGDMIRFTPVNPYEFLAIESEINKGSYIIDKVVIDG